MYALLIVLILYYLDFSIIVNDSIFLLINLVYIFKWIPLLYYL